MNFELKLKTDHSYSANADLSPKGLLFFLDAAQTIINIDIYVLDLSPAAVTLYMRSQTNPTFVDAC